MADSDIFMGISFPFAIDTRQFPAPATDEDLIKQALIQLILTGQGERIMRPTFGANAYSYVFENNDDILQAAIQSSVAAAIGQFETRVILNDVQVERESSDQNQPDAMDQVIVTIKYIVPSTQQQDQVTITLGQTQEAA